MIRRPPRSTRTDTLFPYTTLFRSAPDRNTRANYATRLPFRPFWRIESIPGRDHRGPLDVAAFPSDCAATKIGYNLVLDASARRAKAVERRDGTEDSECRLKQHIEFTSTTASTTSRARHRKRT